MGQLCQLGVLVNRCQQLVSGTVSSSTSGVSGVSSSTSGVSVAWLAVVAIGIIATALIRLASSARVMGNIQMELSVDQAMVDLLSPRQLMAIQRLSGDTL